MSAVLGVDLGKAENLGVGQRPSVLFLHLVQIFYLFFRERETFLLVVGFQVVHILDGLRVMLHGENLLVQPVVHTLQHRVKP